MTVASQKVAESLNRRFFLDFPYDAARKIEHLEVSDVIEAVAGQPVKILAPVWQYILPVTAAKLFRAMPNALADPLLEELLPPVAARILGYMSTDEQVERLGRLDPDIGRELTTILTFPAQTAGRLMDTRVPTFRREDTAGQTLERLRSMQMKTARNLFLVDDHHRLCGRVLFEDVALHQPDTVLGSLERQVTAFVRPMDSQAEMSAAFETKKVLDLPVVDLDNVFLGAVTHTELAHTIQEDATINLQTMVGAGKEERALSSPWFTVKKRMPWLQINLVTAFMAAAVVGIFEATIAQVTALAVLLPVVAGQSGNTGAQALAVTMRGLALREITVRQWARVMRKEVIAGVLNGVSIAITCGLGVYIWSQSIGLVLVIMVSMVLAMTAAGFAGAVIPVILTRMGQDPATSSSIILTTVTDIAGFFSFLGIATLLMQFL